MDDGILTDGLGRKVDFKNTILIMTSNIGTRDIQINKVLGFGESNTGSEYQKMKESIDDAVKKIFSPEFLNRVDDFLVFKQLEKQSLYGIVEIAVKKLTGRLLQQNIKIEITESAKEFLVDKGFDKIYGARPLRRAIQKYLEDPLSEEILNGNIKFNSIVKLLRIEGEDGFKFESMSLDSPEESKEIKEEKNNKN